MRPDVAADQVDQATAGPPPVEAATAEALATYRQGDLLPDMRSLPVLDEDGRPCTYATPRGAVLLSQTCDIVQASRRTVQVAPLVTLPAGMAADARDGKRPRYVHVPEAGLESFADLEVIATVVKAHLAGHAKTTGVGTDDGARRFGRAVARRFGRFAFPDEIVPWLAPLAEVAASKAAKSSSPEGQALAQVVELRVEATGGWLRPPYELVLAVVVEPGALPTFPGDGLPDCPSTLVTWLHGRDGELRRTAGDIAGRLVTAHDPAEKYFCWMSPPVPV